MKLFFQFTVIAFIGLGCLMFSSCEPETIIETELITVHDTLIVSSTDTVIITVEDTLIVTSTDTIFLPVESEVTRFILVRHAETASGGSDPLLSQAGMDRADNLARILSEVDLSAVYSTNFNRTTQTASPTVNNQGLTLQTYGGFDHHQVIDDILENMSESTVLIVGHSNTTPNFLNALTGTSDYPNLPESAYDNLFIVNTKSKGDAEVIHLKY